MRRTIRARSPANKRSGIRLTIRTLTVYRSAVIRTDRLKALFLDLVRIDSLSRREGHIAERLARELDALGARVEFDRAHEAVGGEVGNLVAHVPGTVDAPPFLLCAHMDTVEPGIGVRPVDEGDVIRSDGTTVLGGDDKSGISIVCECLRAAREHGVRHPPVDVVFTICEELGLLGSRHLAPHRRRGPRTSRARRDGAGARHQRDPCGVGGDRGHASRPHRPGDHRQRGHDPGRTRDQHRARRGASPR
jgi:acetylornithine deacetylase/succinyl-diaminopimelate desuccinylase-like protein